jgi:hypothetical protein
VVLIQLLLVAVAVVDPESPLDVMEDLVEAVTLVEPAVLLVVAEQLDKEMMEELPQLHIHRIMQVVAVVVQEQLVKLHLVRVTPVMVV